jgi:hypothetical protein
MPLFRATEGTKLTLNLQIHCGLLIPALPKRQADKGLAMDLVLIELLLWGGLIFFFWALKDGLGSVEADIESLGMLKSGNAANLTAAPPEGMSCAERMEEPIGSYMGKEIFRYAIIGGKRYRFDRVQPPFLHLPIDADERFIDPGLVYQECGDAPEAVPA